MTREEYISLQTGDTIYMKRSGRARVIISKEKPLGGMVLKKISSNGYRNSNTTYCNGDKNMFSKYPVDKSPPTRIENDEENHY